MSQIFDNSYKSVKNISAATLKVTWWINNSSGSASDLPMFMTGVNIRYQRGVSPMYVLNTDNGNDTQLNIVGRPSGDLTVSSIVAAYKSDLEAFLAAVGVTCANEKNSVSMRLSPIAGTCSDAMYSYTIKGVLLNSVNVSMQSGAVAMVTDQLSFTFLDLSLSAPVKQTESVTTTL